MAESQPSQQVRIDLVLWAWFRGMRPRNRAFQAHNPHEPLDPFAVDRVTIQTQPVCHLPGTKERCFQVLLINDPHQGEVVVSLASGLVVVARARQPNQGTLPGRADFRVAGLNQHALTLRGA